MKKLLEESWDNKLAYIWSWALLESFFCIFYSIFKCDVAKKLLADIRKLCQKGISMYSCENFFLSKYRTKQTCWTKNKNYSTFSCIGFAFQNLDVNSNILGNLQNFKKFSFYIYEVPVTSKTLFLNVKCWWIRLLCFQSKFVKKKPNEDPHTSMSNKATDSKVFARNSYDSGFT